MWGVIIIIWRYMDFLRSIYPTHLMINVWYMQVIFSHHIAITSRPMNFSKYIVSMNDSRRIKGWIFTAFGLGDAFVIYQKVLSRMAWESFVAVFFSYGSNADGKMNYESKAESRNFFFFFLRVLPLSLPMSSSTIVRPLSQSFCACRFKSVG